MDRRQKWIVFWVLQPLFIYFTSCVCCVIYSFLVSVPHLCTHPPVCAITWSFLMCHTCIQLSTPPSWGGTLITSCPLPDCCVPSSSVPYSPMTPSQVQSWTPRTPTPCAAYRNQSHRLLHQEEETDHLRCEIIGMSGSQEDLFFAVIEQLLQLSNHFQRLAPEVLRGSDPLPVPPMPSHPPPASSLSSLPAPHLARPETFSRDSGDC